MVAGKEVSCSEGKCDGMKTKEDKCGEKMKSEDKMDS
jgi:hypothetical protein